MDAKESGKRHPDRAPAHGKARGKLGETEGKAGLFVAGPGARPVRLKQSGDLSVPLFEIAPIAAGAGIANRFLLNQRIQRENHALLQGKHLYSL